MQGFVDASLEIDELFTPADMLVLYATTGAIASAGHWVVNYASAHKGKNLDFDAVALEALRFGGLNTSLPPRSRSENGRHVIVCISPAMVLRDESIVGEDPYSFDPERYTDEKYGFKRKTVTRTMAFGPGVQRCPSAPAIVPFLRSLAEQIQDSEICTTPADASKPSKKDLNAFRPNRKSDCTIV